MSRGRSLSPAREDADMDMEPRLSEGKPDAKVVVVTNLTRNVVESHLQTVFGFYGEISKIDLPLFGNSGQNRGKAALEYLETLSARKAVSHMNGGQLDGATLKVELSDLPIRRRSRTPPPRGGRNGRTKGGRSLTRSRSPRHNSRSPSRSRSRTRSLSPVRSRSPPYRRGGGGYGGRADSFRGRGGYGRRGGPPAGRERDRPPHRPGANRSRSRSPIRRGGYNPAPPRRRSPSYTRGGVTRGRRTSRSRSRSYSVRSSRSRTRSFSPRSRSRSMSYSSKYSRSRSRTRSVSRGRRSSSRDDIRDSRSRSPGPRAP
ncbi:hypothetical protein DFP72DRAFT_876791 [Ephemerocybe angulata]|uniref:RRM domain-containing protein n=1 Tax=Ephemerocybe angulata TaxID=980116 RepID=A0A8H6MEE2_9AGAR|nr:hypothetical protein DFP72DRAFT_876791 [Tulosesus angulatus]